MSEVVRLISGSKQLTLDACDGERTIAKATDIFSHIDADFKNWGTDVAQEATLETPVAVYEIVKDDNFAEMFGSLNSDEGKLVLTQNQILNFIQKYREWLRKYRWATCFLFRVKNKFFVALVSFYLFGGLEVFIYQFEDDRVWGADRQRRLVVPKLQPFDSLNLVR